MADIIVSPGLNGVTGLTGNIVLASPPTLTLSTSATGDLVVPGLMDASIGMANDVYSWTQLNYKGKRNIATTSTNSISTNVVVEETEFYGNATTSGTNAAGSASNKGLFGLSNDKTRVDFEINVGTKKLSGKAYITGLTQSISADQPIWTTPITLSVDGDYTVA